MDLICEACICHPGLRVRLWLKEDVPVHDRQTRISCNIGRCVQTRPRWVLGPVLVPKVPAGALGCLPSHAGYKACGNYQQHGSKTRGHPRARRGDSGPGGLAGKTRMFSNIRNARERVRSLELRFLFGRKLLTGEEDPPSWSGGKATLVLLRENDV